ncbi:MAG: hypothetical protein HY271_13655 [Deltaproteobacteria bacterium]|nr:hypothetical protein [Deltaproteobacteria bacterium]
MDHGGAALVAAAPSTSGLEAGDVIRQANGLRVESCADLERAAAEAMAKGLVLLLGVEREGRLLGIAATTPAIDARVAARADGETPAAPPRPIPPPLPGNAAPAPALAAVVTPRPRRAAVLPPRGDASADLRRRAATAGAALARVDDAARPGVPIVVYERRLGDAEAAIAALEFGVAEAESAVRDFVEEAVALHRTARDVRRSQLAMLRESGVDRRASTATGLPYFSDSRVPDWVATYPFLTVTLLESPHETRMPIAGEVAGRWDPDRALELLWDRARAATAELTTWAQA